jgi:hypothetical protein
MGLFDALLGNASAADLTGREEEFASVLVAGEVIERGYKLVRDLIILTNLRILLIDKQGVTGKKQVWMSIPYRSVTRFSKESAGHMDLDAELRIWLRGESAPLVQEFRRGEAIDEVYRALSERVLRGGQGG